MDLMQWKPACRVSVNGRDMTAVFLPRISSIVITDTAGIQSDTCEIILTDNVRIAPLEIPPTGTEMEVALGYGFASQIVGTYIVDEVEVGGPPGAMRIIGYASAHGASDGGKSPLTEQKTRSWRDGITVSQLASTIAGESGFRAAVSVAAGKIELGHIDQIDESDLNLLTRVAREYGLIFKPGGGALVICRPGESSSASGQPIPAVALIPKMVTRWSMRIARRGAYARVVASYRDFGSSEPVDVEVDGTPDDVAGVAQVKRLKKVFPSEAAARAAAEAEARRGQRGARTLSVEMPGRAELMAEGKLSLAGFKVGVDGEWLVSRVVHQMGAGGWRAMIEAETDVDA